MEAASAMQSDRCITVADFVPGVVMPVGPGRHDYANRALKSIYSGTLKPAGLVIVADGWTPDSSLQQIGPCASITKLDHVFHEMQKHEPGREQPRNVGVRILRENFPECTHVWFVDSDVLMDRNALQEYANALLGYMDDIVMFGPYDWMPAGADQPMPELRNDPRWAFFNEVMNDDVKLRTGLNAGLACFSGNLVWPIDEFEEIGGFWNEIHHGRCEDGELGIRAHRDGIEFLPVPEARGWHMDHPRDVPRILEMNARDVPMLNARHPWVEQYGVFVAERDGKRLEQTCHTCGEIVNTIDWWNHQNGHA